MNSDLEKGVNVDRANFGLLSQQGLQSCGNLATKMKVDNKAKCTNTCGTCVRNMWNRPPVSSFYQNCSVPLSRWWHPPRGKVELHLTWYLAKVPPSLPVFNQFLVLTLPVRGSVADCLSASLCSLAASSTSSSSTILLNLILETIRLCLRVSI